MFAFSNATTKMSGAVRNRLLSLGLDRPLSDSAGAPEALKPKPSGPTARSATLRMPPQALRAWNARSVTLWKSPEP